jgi:hypothetical protein
MPGSLFSLPGLRHSYVSGNYSRSHPGRVVPGELGGTVYGASINGPKAFFPTEDNLDDFSGTISPYGLVSAGSASADGTTEWFWTLNSGTFLLSSTTAGFEGKIAGLTNSTTTTSAIHTQSFKSIANAAANGGRWSAMMIKCNFPNPTTHNFSFNFGFGNKQVDPITSQYTDGTWIEVITATSLQFNGRVRHASGTASTTTLTNFLMPANAAISFELGVVQIGQTKNIFFMRDMSATTPINSGNWAQFSPATDTVWPAPTVELRPTLALAGAAAVTFNFESPRFAIENTLTA